MAQDLIARIADNTFKKINGIKYYFKEFITIFIIHSLQFIRSICNIISINEINYI
jgi:hypothetical protein